MTEYKIGQFTIKSKAYYDALMANKVTGHAQLKKLDTNGDKILTEDELVALEEGFDDSTDTKKTNNSTQTSQNNSEVAKTIEQQIEDVKESYEKQIVMVYEQMDALEEKRRACTNKLGTAKDVETTNSYLQSLEQINGQIQTARNQIVTLAASMESKIAQLNSSKTTLDSSGTYNINTASATGGNSAATTPITTANFSYNFSEKLTASQQNDLKSFKAHWEKYKSRYQAVANKTGVPAQLIAAIHWRESTGNFNTRLHDGRALGNFSSWEASAIDALKGGYGKIDTNNIQTWYDFAERYNGLGYRKKGVSSPYVWAGTTNYTSGKYVADGVYDGSYVDKQIGVAVMLKAIL